MAGFFLLFEAVKDFLIYLKEKYKKAIKYGKIFIMIII